MVAAAALGLIATGCGGDDDEGSASTAPELEKVSLQLAWVAQNQFAGYYVGLEKGFYAEEGIDLDVKPGGPDIVPVQRLATGQDDFGVVFAVSALAARETGADITNIFQVWQVGPTALVCHRDSGITTPADLKGKTISTFLGPNQFPFFSILEQAGLDPLKDVKLVGQALGMEPFIQGKVDCASGANYNEHLQVTEAGVDPDSIVTFTSQEDGIDFLEDGVYMPGGDLQDEQKRDIAVGFVKASIRGWDDAFKDPDGATDIVLEYAGEGVVSKQHQLDQLEIIRDQNVLVGASLEEGVGYMDPDVLQRSYDGALKYGMIEKEQDLSTFYTHEIWEEAVAELEAEGLVFENGLLVEK